MVTKQQLEALRASRNRLVPVLNHTPRNATFSYIRSGLDIDRESTIKAHENSLVQASKTFRRQHTRAQTKGKAQYQFNKQQEIKL